ncbi:amino acid adenylation domain-containing protein [Amycolatopsis sp. H20-H5]|uniref:amino acid adenylation domain-containing protein n=1 Tax=Amycolatopsis sp. H20-H5 TaxID=3046309 RepID=UPI002DBEC8B7|nr:amino acid adenylation domain-containing protein [Amycolatopsis sp. H20-H5]MEC3974234.1 amino acid adenylation domain-containing protein [Amycolatopsis sp. H20-H5]
MPRPDPRPSNPFPLTRAQPERVFPLSTGQERLWWLRQLDAADDRYHISGGWRFDADLDPAALSAAFAGLLARHEILRTRFVLQPDGTTAQEVLDEVEVPISLAGTGWQEAVDQAVSTLFDLTRPPLLRAVLVELDGGHGLFVAMHHIVTDRWSMDVLPRDLFELYEAALENRAPRLPVLAVQYGDYARWQRRFLTAEVLRPHLGYWEKALSAGERLELPLDRPRPAAVGAAGKTVVVELSKEATTAMTAVAWRARASPVMVVTAALVEVLSAFSGQSDVVIGAIISDRPSPELQDLIGFFVNTVILRVELSSPERTFREIITRTRDAWMAADAHQDAPFEQIVGTLKAGSDAWRHPVFDIAINHAGDRTGLSEAAGAPTWWRPELPVTARFDLSLTSQVVDGRLRATFLYRPALFDEAPIAALASRYLRLLEQGLTAPDRPVREFDLLEETERRRLHGRNDTTSAPEITVAQRVEAQAAARPQAPAVAGAEGVVTYEELNSRANQLARHLLSYGLGPERVVAVCLDHTIERCVVLLAIAKCGAAYFPLDPGFPADRLRMLLSDTGASLTIVSPGLRNRLPAGTAPTLEFSRDTPELTGHGTGNLPPRARAGNLAYLISTSGSTGTPKAVAVSHRALSRLVEGAPRYLDVGPGSVFLQAGPLTFDVAVLEWTPLAHGGCVVVTDTGTLLDGMAAVVRDHGVTTLKLVSPQLDLLVEQGIQALSGLRQLVVGGDVVNPKSFTAAVDGLPGCRVMASYGPTESTVLATVFDDRSWTGRVPIGHPVPHTSVYVLDRDLRPAAVGMRGEIYLAGDGLARGYHGRPGLTAGSFVPDPHGPPGTRMYRTGDVGRYLPTGAIDFLGRADHQVKIRGYRIETSEIEHVLLRLPGITSAVVVRAELDTGPGLVAYVVATTHVDPAALRRELGETLPAYLVPSRIIQVPRFTLTGNNKVDRTALPPVTAAAPRQDHGTPPATGLAARVAEAWSAVLGQTMPATEDFFEHGGHSLLVPRATAAVRALLGREVPLRLMMENRTPVSYAAAVLRESLSEHAGDDRLDRQRWQSKLVTGDRRVDFFLSTGSSGPPERTLVVLDGAEFADILRLPAILDRLTAAGRIPVTAAVFVSPVDLPARRRELLDDRFVDVLADELLPALRDWLGERWRPGRATAVGASLGAITAVRAALRRPDCFDGAVGLSGPLTDHVLTPAVAAETPARLFLSAGVEEADIVLDDGVSLLDANTRTAKELDGHGCTVRCEQEEGGHTYAAWEAALPRAISWVLDARCP